MAMPKGTTVQKLWNQIDKLKVALNDNPHPQIQEAKKITSQMEKTIKTLRHQEIVETEVNTQ